VRGGGGRDGGLESEAVQREEVLEAARAEERGEDGGAGEGRGAAVGVQRVAGEERRLGEVGLRAREEREDPVVEREAGRRQRGERLREAPSRRTGPGGAPGGRPRPRRRPRARAGRAPARGGALRPASTATSFFRGWAWAWATAAGRRGGFWGVSAFREWRIGSRRCCSIFTPSLKENAHTWPARLLICFVTD
jgi:hypothetical protein